MTSSAEQDSGLQAANHPDKRLRDSLPTDYSASEISINHTQRKAGELWINGEVLMCACPNCQAPMSVRLWLMAADCWQCGTSITLSEEQERQAQQLLKQKKNTEKAAIAVPNKELASRTKPPAAPKEKPRFKSTNLPPPPKNRISQTVRSSQSLMARDRMNRLAPMNRTATQISDLFKDVPAWLVSFIFHVVLLILFGLFTIEEESDGPTITLSLAISKETRKGGDIEQVDPEDELAFDLPLPAKVDMKNKQVREEMMRANQAARELRLDPNDPSPHLPDLEHVKKELSQRNAPHRTLASRDPRIRVEVVKREGGTTLTEAAVARGLRWLAAHQNRDGSWSLDGFDHSEECSCEGVGLVHSNIAGTSLALLPFLGAGQTHRTGRYQSQVEKGLRWMVINQKPNGDLRGNSSRESGMYAQGQAAIVLCEAFWMTGDELLRRPAQKAIDFIVQAQHPAGGWRYHPGQQGDTSVLGWQLMALQSARGVNLHVPDEAFEKADRFLDSVQFSNGSLYSYQSNRRPTHVMTAEALLCRMYLGWTREHKPLIQGMHFLTTNSPPSANEPNYYYWYYGTQAMHHLGGESWLTWNRQMRDILVEKQERTGHEAGSWPPEGPFANAGGRIYSTSLAVCSLEVYYRHLPLYRQIKLD